MDKVHKVCEKSSLVMSGWIPSTSSNYSKFLKDFRNKRIEFGSMAEDRKRYSKDLGLVFNDYKKSSIKIKHTSKFG